MLVVLLKVKYKNNILLIIVFFKFLYNDVCKYNTLTFVTQGIQDYYKLPHNVLMY